MGPVTRSTHRNQANTKNVLANKTNMPRMNERNKNKKKQCVYSHNVGEENTHEGLTVYEFVGTNSPPRKVVKKRKPRKKKHLSDDDIIFPISKIENVRYNTRQGHTASAENKNKMKNVKSVSFPSENNGNIMSVGGEKESTNSEENKENMSVVKETEYMLTNYMNATVKPLDTVDTNIRYNTRQGHTISAENKNKVKNDSSVPFPSGNNENIMSVGGEKESTNSEENKENMSAVKEIEYTVTSYKNETAKPLDRPTVDTNTENVKYDTRQEHIISTENKKKMKNCSTVSFPSENNGNISEGEEKGSTNSEENKESISANTHRTSNSCVFIDNIQQDSVGHTISEENKNKMKNGSNVSFPSENNGSIMYIRGEKESTNSEENRENISAVKEIEYMVTNDMNATAKPIEIVDTNTQSTGDSCFFADNIQQDVVWIPPDSENKKNYSDTGFRDSTCSFGFSPIQHENRDLFVTKRVKKRKYCVEDFTIENCFGFDKDSDDMKSPEHSVLYAMSSTPNDKNDPTRLKMQMSNILMPAQLNPAPNKTCISTSTYNKVKNKANSVDSIAAFSSVEISNPAFTQNNQLNDVTSTKLLQATSAKLPRVTSTKLPQDKSTKLPQVTSTKLPQVTSTKLQVTSAKLSQDMSTEKVICTKMPQVTSTVISNDYAVLFGDNLVERHFNKPPRRSYERKAQMHRNLQCEPDSASEDEICKADRNKCSKKRKVKEDKNFHKWAANVSAEFEEVESFQLLVE